MFCFNPGTQVAPDLLWPHGESRVELVSSRRIIVGWSNRLIDYALSSRREGEINVQAIASGRNSNSKKHPKNR